MDIHQLNFDTQQLPQLFLQLQQQLDNLQRQVQQHKNLLSKLNKLEEENNTLKKENRAKDHVIEELRHQIETQQISKNSSAAADSQENLDRSTRKPVSVNTSYSDAAKKGAKANHVTIPARSQKRRLAAARAFKTVSAKGPLGFEYVYIGRSGKIERAEVRSRFRRIGVDTGRVLDVCFPASGVIGVLLHTQYVATFTDLMKKSDAEVIEGFDPHDPANIADPKYASLSDSEREDFIHQLVEDRAMQTLSFLRPLNVSAVGKYFESLGWITAELLAESVAAAMGGLAKVEPRKAAFLFKSRRITADDDGASDCGSSDMQE